jgi:hypothetical protein
LSQLLVPPESDCQNTGGLLANLWNQVCSLSLKFVPRLREDAVMKTDPNVISQLKRELAFLASGGYRVGTGWAPLRYFEDSPICNRISETCDASCPLRNFVAVEWREEPAPCRYIPLNDAGETLNSLYVTGTNQEIESAVRHWLVSVIGKLESIVADELDAEAA